MSIACNWVLGPSLERAGLTDQAILLGDQLRVTNTITN